MRWFAVVTVAFWFTAQPAEAQFVRLAELLLEAAEHSAAPIRAAEKVAEKTARAAAHLEAPLGELVAHSALPRQRLLTQLERLHVGAGSIDTRFAPAAAQLGEELSTAEHWLAAFNHDRRTSYLTVVDDQVVMSSQGGEFERIVSGFDASDARLQHDVVISPQVLRSNAWRQIAHSLEADQARVSIAWQEFGQRHVLPCSWVDTRLTFEARPNLFVDADSKVGAWLLATDREAARGTTSEASSFEARLQRVPAEPFAFDELVWLNLQTAGDTRALADLFPKSRRARLKLQRNDQAANLERFNQTARGLRGKTVLLTAHVEEGHFVSRFAGGELFRIPVEDAIATLQSEGVNVIPLGCELAQLAGVGPLDMISPRTIAEGLKRAQSATNMFEFFAQFASEQQRMVAIDIDLMPISAANEAANTGRVFGKMLPAQTARVVPPLFRARAQPVQTSIQPDNRAPTPAPRHVQAPHPPAAQPATGTSSWLRSLSGKSVMALFMLLTAATIRRRFTRRSGT